VTFTDLEPEAEQDFADYVRQGKLVVSSVAVFDANTRRAEVKQFGERMGISSFKEFFKGVGDNLKAGDLKAIYEKLQTEFTDLPKAGSKEANATALHEYESNHPERCELIPSEDQFYGFSKGANRLAKYLQWVYVPAVKDAASELIESRNTALGKLLARTVRLKTKFSEHLKEIRGKAQEEYETVLQQNQSALDDISKSLQARRIEWAHPDASLRLEWRNDPEKSVQVQDPFAQIIASEGDFEGELTRFGHGLQRSYLLALLQELAGATDGSEPKLVLVVEEPELYQHPPQARHLAGILRQLGGANSQVIVCTHSPYFVSGEGFEDVRMVRKDSGAKCTTVASLSYTDLLKAWEKVTGEKPKKSQGVLAKVHQELQPQMNEMFFTSRLVLVEGLEDVAFITTQLHLSGLWDEYRRSGCHLVPVGGKNHMIPALLIAKRLGIPTFIVFDSDAHKTLTEDRRKMHEKDNSALLTLSGVDAFDPTPNETLWSDRGVMWHSEIGEVVEEEIGKENWQQFSQIADQDYGAPGGLQKNTLHVAASLAYAWEAGDRSKSLERLCKEMLDFGKKEPNQPNHIQVEEPAPVPSVTQ
jgi:putative ATP-dependent endonuclease of the OLD family